MDQRAPSVVMATARATGPHLTVAGDLDADGAARLRALLDDAIAPGVRLTLDLSRVTYVSAAALTLLVQAYCRLRDGGGAMALTDASPSVIRVLRISGLHRVLQAEQQPPHAVPTPAVAASST